MVMDKGKHGMDLWCFRWFRFILIWCNSHLSVDSFSRVYAAYGGIFIVMALLWGWIFDGIAPDLFDQIGSLVAVVGVLIIFYAPRKGERAVWSR